MDSKEYFGSDTETIKDKKWNWLEFTSTKDFPVSDKLLDWVVGQDKALEECYLCLDEWLYKLKYLQEAKWYEPWLNPFKDKPVAKQTLTPGPYLLLLGDPGTGKSLIGRAMSEKLTQVYMQHGIKMFDVLTWYNRVIEQEPKISIHEAGEGSKVVTQENLKGRTKSFFKGLGWKLLTGTLLGLGLFLLGIGLWNIFGVWLLNSAIKEFYHNDFFLWLALSLQDNYLFFMLGGSLSFSGAFLYFIPRWMGNVGTRQGIGGADSSKHPKLLIDNSKKVAPFIDATGHGSAQLFGSVAWDPYQCYSEDTTIYTLNGFKGIRELSIGDKVLSINPQNKHIEVASVTNIFMKNYDGYMINFKGQRYNLLVTPNHRMLTEENEVLAMNLKPNQHLPHTFFWKSTKSMHPSLIKLIGWYASRGHFRKDRKYIMLVASKNSDREEICSILNKLKCRYYINGKDIVISELSIYHFLKKCNNYSLNKEIPREYLDLDVNSLEILFDTMMKGNGNRNKDLYYSSSKKLIENFVEIATKLGYHTTVGIDNRNRKSFYVSVSKKVTCYIKNGNIHLVKYKGKVWCPHLDKNHYMLVERNGFITFSGNTGGLGTPSHKRVTAGDVHRASLGILYIDEIKNLHPQEAITLLTVLEDGQLPVTMRSQMRGADTSAMAVSTEPIPCMTFLIGAGNFDSINQLHPALMDRLVGYGKVVRMSNDMANTLPNRRKYVQFISQESSRFHLPPFSKDACIELINEGRRRSNKRDCLTTKFRPLISIIKTAGTLAQNSKSTLVEACHVTEAINEHCKTIQKQLLEHHIEEQGRFMEIEPKGSMLGSIYGLAVSSDQYSGEMTGNVLKVKAQLIKRNPKDYRKGYYTVTGIAKDSKWIKASVDKVRSVILKKYNVDIAQDYFTHIDFSQAYGVDGPSAGVTMAILLCSLIEGKPINQSVAVTGEINISSTDDIVITAIGGVHEKIKSAESWLFDKVVIPHKNYKHSIDPKDYKIKIIGARTLDEYLKETLVNSDSVN